MIDWFVILAACACLPMYGVARMDGANSALWAGITFAVCFGLGLGLSFVFQGGSLVGTFLGLVVSFGIYFAKKVMSDTCH